MGDLRRRDTFQVVGPWHLHPVDWSLPEHRRSIAASLVRSICVLERYEKQDASEDLASTWWEFFDFELLDTLRDPDDSSIYGAIFRYKLHRKNHSSYKNVPRYVIAFRGTMIKRRTCYGDFKLDVRVILNRLCMSTRYQVAVQAVEGLVADWGSSNIWLAGHSLGSAIALQVGKDMAKRGYFLETYLFNPPFPSTPTEKFRNQRLKDSIRYARSLLTASLVIAIKGYNSYNRDEYDPNFAMLSSWTPYLFVHPSDPLCSEYIAYFEHREKMLARGSSAIERVAAQNSIVSLVSMAIGKDVEPTHLIPSAYLFINKSSDQHGFKQVHGMSQWWEPHQVIEHKLYQLSSEILNPAFDLEDEVSLV
ncbi:hypothetical protein RND81_12G101100 [Saponaria officinalis]|uniref:Fungal lipase-type domain-containing protein n=1 Tax=Saponaria officinalis TaxID=3572 RepID=A0AAW1H8R1_SAPOF